MSEMSADEQRVRAAVESLGEHFDSVQVFVTRHEGGRTRHVVVGMGNWFARYGQVNEWAMRMAEVEMYDEEGSDD